ncbi:hypothetical protein [Streptomyces sp. NPDC096311]|uniref:hypothetical protein n=1 Tax=Streptomyces sp. NPDC096311 TaxID=3366083 RepID=UPI00380668A0
MSKVLLRSGLDMFGSDRGIATRVRRDIEAAVRVSRFNTHDTELALVIVVGAVLCLGQFLHDHPERDDAEATDHVVEELLRMFGLSADETHEICRRPLPDIPTAQAGRQPTGPLHTSAVSPSFRKEGVSS